MTTTFQNRHAQIDHLLNLVRKAAARDLAAHNITMPPERELHKLAAEMWASNLPFIELRVALQDVTDRRRREKGIAEATINETIKRLDKATLQQPANAA